MPSTTYNGVELANEPLPRILTVGPDPGAPLFIIFTPGTFPCNAVIGEEAGVDVSSEPLITLIGEVRSLAFADP